MSGEDFTAFRFQGYLTLGLGPFRFRSRYQRLWTLPRPLLESGPGPACGRKSTTSHSRPSISPPFAVLQVFRGSRARPPNSERSTRLRDQIQHSTGEKSFQAFSARFPALFSTVSGRAANQLTVVVGFDGGRGARKGIGLVTASAEYTDSVFPLPFAVTT